MSESTMQTRTQTRTQTRAQTQAGMLESLLALRDAGGVRRSGAVPDVGSAAAWIDDLRSGALAAFREQGVPTRRLEAWKGTSFAPLEAMRFTRLGPDEQRAAAFSLLSDSPERSAERCLGSAAELVFVDGRFDAQGSSLAGLPSGCRVASLAETVAESPELMRGRLGQLTDPKRQALVALQTALLEDGAVLVLAPGTVLSDPIQLRFLSTGGASETDATAAFPRLLLVAGAQSQAIVHQSFESLDEAPGFTAFVSELHLAESARIEIVEVQDEAERRIHFSSVHARLERDARLDSHVFSLGNGLTRSELELTLVGPGAEARLRGFFLGRDAGHVDHYTTIEHAVAHCTSDQEYRGVLGGRSRGVFRGRVLIRPDAQKSDARQSNPNLLVSEHATIDSKPQLEIYADDVRASHGSTIGQLDADALFFLRARGIGLADARLLLTRAFAGSIVDDLSDDRIRAGVATRVEEALKHLVVAGGDDDGASRASAGRRRPEEGGSR